MKETKARPDLTHLFSHLRALAKLLVEVTKCETTTHHICHQLFPVLHQGPLK